MTERKLPKIDNDELTVPISDLMPSGESLRRGPVYDKIKLARKEDDPVLDHGIWATEPKSADWDTVILAASTALKDKTKDLWIGCWLAEGWAAKYGVAGARQGIELLTTLVEEFWDTLHPPIDDDGDFDGRIAPFGWLNSQLATRLKKVTLIDPEKRDRQALTWLDWERATLLERSGKSPTDGQVTTADFMTSVLLTAVPFYRVLAEDLAALRTAVDTLEETVDARCGEPVTALYQLKGAVEALQGFVKRALSQKGETESEAEAGPDDAVGDEEGGPVAEDMPAGGGRRGPIRNRAEAYQRLAEAADYLMRVEPHSPVPHLVKRAVSWGNMSFADLIPELVNDRNNLFGIFQLLGLGDPSQR